MNKKVYVSYWILFISIALLILGFCIYNNLYFYKHLFISIKSFGESLVYYFLTIFNISSDLNVPDTFYDYAIKGFGEINLPFASSWEILLTWFTSQFFMIFNKDYLSMETSGVIFFFSHIQIFLLFIVSFILLIVCFDNLYFSPHFNGKYGYSKNWKRFDKFLERIFVPIQRYFFGFVNFLKHYILLIKIIIFLVLLIIGVISICLDFLAYYFIFSSRFDFVFLWKLLYSTLYSLYPIITMLPLFIWLIVIYFIFTKIRYKNGIKRLSHLDHLNRNFVSGLGVATFIKGPPGCGKTKLMTDFVMTSEQNNRYSFLEIINKYKALFVNFNFFEFFKTIDILRYSKTITNPFQLEAWIDKRKYTYSLYKDGTISFNDKAIKSLLFQFNFRIYEERVFDGLKNISLFEMMDIVGCSYFYYSTRSSLEFGNYPIRNDSRYCSDGSILGVWKYDYFTIKKDDIDRFTYYSHILDNNMLRMGKKVTSEHPTPWLGAYTVYLDEADKERGNQFDKVGMKKDDQFANLVNDYYNLALKLSRHWSTIDYKPFFKFITTAQRPGSINSDMVETNESIITINGSVDKFALHGYLVEAMILDTLNKFYFKFNKEYSLSRNYYSLIYRFINFVFKYFYRHFLQIINTFSYSVLSLKLEDGSQNVTNDGTSYYMLDKKIYSNRYSTDVYKTWFSKAALNNYLDLDDIPTFNDLYTTNSELNYMNSYMWSNIQKLQENDKKEDVTYEK
ncbi:MAG: hypothetical protein WCR97_03955 [Bacilli bacterium]